MPLDDKKESWSSIYTIPPSIKYPYNPLEALNDIPGISHALDLFLASHMLESEDYCNKSDDKKCVPTFFVLSYLSHTPLPLESNRERLYFATGYGLIQCVKGLMSYEDEASTLHPLLHLLFKSILTRLISRISSQESLI